jgi:uncharacterized iron-regulated membrane protein
MNKAPTRQFWTTVHRYLGLASLFFLLIAGVTGSFLCFDKRVDAAINSDLFYRDSGAARITPPELAASLEVQRPDLVVTSFPLNLDASANLKLSVAPRVAGTVLGFNELFIDPSDVRVVGTRQSGPGWDRRHIVEGIFQLHQNLVAGKWGRWIMGLAALAWLTSSFVGLYLTFPAKKPFWPKWKKKWKIDVGAHLRRFMLEVHNASGLWLLIPAAVLAYTSVAMNFFDEAFVPVVEAVSPSRPSLFDKTPKAISKRSPNIGFEKALQIGTAAAKSEGLEWRPALERYNAEHNVYGVTFTDNGLENYHGLGPITYYLDASSGRLIERDDPYTDSFGRKLSRSLYPLHSGEMIGPAGIAIIFLLGLATSEMCITGFYTWWKKRESRSGRRSAARLGKA